MSVLVDTSVLIDHLRGSRAATALLQELFDAEGRVWAAVPSRTEIIAGVRDHERDAMDELFAILDWIDVDASVADAAGHHARRFARSHLGIDTTDYLIAAAAASVGARLVTLNVRHFPMFEGLEPPYAD